MTIGHRVVKVDSKISEGMLQNLLYYLGGFAFVYKVVDINSFTPYALKKMVVQVIYFHIVINPINSLNKLRQISIERLQSGNRLVTIRI